MGHRIAETLIYICGTLVVIFLILLGVDIYLAARTGGRWKRKLVSAGLFLLAIAGVIGWGSRIAPAAPEATQPMNQAAPAEELQDTKEWKLIVAGWQAVTTLTENVERTADDHKKANEAMTAAREAVKELAQVGRITQAEAGLLAAEAEQLLERMYSHAPSDCQIMCYETVLVYPAQKSLDQLNKRLPLLKQIAESGKVQTVVIERTIPVVEADLKVLTSDAELAKLSEESREQAHRAAEEISALIERVKALLPSE